MNNEKKERDKEDHMREQCILALEGTHLSIMHWHQIYMSKMERFRKFKDEHSMFVLLNLRWNTLSPKHTQYMEIREGIQSARKKLLEIFPLFHDALLTATAQGVSDDIESCRKDYKEILTVHQKYIPKSLKKAPQSDASSEGQ